MRSSHHPSPPRRTDALQRRHRARRRARRARRPRRLACRRRCSPLPCARGLRPRALQRRARHTHRRWRRRSRSSDRWPSGRSTTVRPSCIGHQLWWSADVDAGTRPLPGVPGRSARNEPERKAAALWFLGFLEWRAGNWEEADRYAADSLELGTQLGQLTPVGELPAAVDCRSPGPDRRRAREGARRDRPGRGRGNPHRAVGPRLGARLHRALAGRRGCSARHT